jgi:hypothetical protein
MSNYLKHSLTWLALPFVKIILTNKDNINEDDISERSNRKSFSVGC